MSELSPVAFQFATPLEMAQDLGAKPELRWIDTGSLLIDRAYQRDILEVGSRNIRRIVKNFRWSRFGALLVADRGDGRFAVVDGQHRSVAALVLGIPKVPCLVIACDREEEARAFAALNGGVTRPHALQIFRARAVAGDKDARELVALCESCGVTILGAPSTITKPGQTMAVGSLLSVRAKHGDKILGMTLRAIVETGGGNIGKLGPAVIGGLCDALGKRAIWRRDQDQLNAAIEVADIGKLLTTAARIRALDGGSTRALFAAAAGKALDRADAERANTAKRS